MPWSECGRQPWLPSSKWYCDHSTEQVSTEQVGWIQSHGHNAEACPAIDGLQEAYNMSPDLSAVLAVIVGSHHHSFDTITD